MATQWVEDPSWGNVFKGFFDQMQAAPEEAAKTALTIEQLKTARQNRLQKQQLWDAAVESGNRFEAALPQVDPSQYTVNTVGPMVGDISNPQDTAGVPAVSYADPRVKAQLDANRALAVATGKQAALADKTSEMFPLLAYGQVGTAGVPDSAAERHRLQFLATGKMPEPPDESKVPLKNYVVTDPNDPNKIIARGVTRDMQNDAATGQAIPRIGPVQVAGAASTTAPNVYGDQGLALQTFAALADKANRNIPLTAQEIEQAHVLREMLFPQKGTWQSQGGRQQWVTERQTPVPDYAGRISGLIDAYRGGAHLAPGATTAPAAAPATAAPPIVPPGPIAANTPQFGPQGPANPAELRKEITNTQAYSDYATAVPSYNTVVAAAQAPPTNATDLNIIYGIAKLFDPGSVVREGELKLAASTGTIGQQLEAMFNRLFNDKGTLSPETRANLIEQGRIRMQQYKNAWDTQKNYYAGIAPKLGLDPADVVPPSPEMTPFDRSQIAPSSPSSSIMRTRPTPAPSATPTPSPSTPVDHDAVRRILGMQ